MSVLGDAMHGDGMLFVREDAVELHGLSSIPYSQMKQPCINTSQARGDLVRLTAYLLTWAAGTIPKIKRAQPIIQSRLKQQTQFVVANNISRQLSYSVFYRLS
jgi:hypothetical protein